MFDGEISHTFLPLKFSKISKLWLVGLSSDTRPAQSRCDRPDNRHVIAPHLLKLRTGGHS